MPKQREHANWDSPWYNLLIAWTVCCLLKRRASLTARRRGCQCSSTTLGSSFVFIQHRSLKSSLVSPMNLWLDQNPFECIILENCSEVLVFHPGRFAGSHGSCSFSCSLLSSMTVYPFSNGHASLSQAKHLKATSNPPDNGFFLVVEVGKRSFRWLPSAPRRGTGVTLFGFSFPDEDNSWQALFPLPFFLLSLLSLQTLSVSSAMTSLRFLVQVARWSGVWHAAPQ